MVSYASKIWNFLFRKSETKTTYIDPETLKNNETIQALAHENAELKAKLNKEKIKQIEDKKFQSQKDSEEEIKEKLYEQQKEIKVQKFPNSYVSLKGFFAKLKRSPKFAETLQFCSFNGENSISKFEDIWITSDGKFALIGQDGEIIWSASNVRDLLYRPANLINDIKARRIPLPVTPDGRHFPNISENWEPEQFVPTPDGRFKFTSNQKQPFYDYISGLLETQGELQRELEVKDTALVKLKNEIDTIKITLKMYKNNSETANANLSETSDEVSEIKKSFGGLANELYKVRDTNSVLEDNLNKIKNQFDIMRNEAERKGVELSDNNAMELIQQIRRELVKDEPTREVKVIHEQSQVPMVQNQK